MLVYRTSAYDTVWHRGLASKLLRLPPDKHIGRMIMEDLPVLAGIQPAELRQLVATISLANRAIHDPNRVLHGQLVGQQDAHQ